MSPAANWLVVLAVLAFCGGASFWIKTYGRPVAVLITMLEQRFDLIGRHRRSPQLTRRY